MSKISTKEEGIKLLESKLFRIFLGVLLIFLVWCFLSLFIGYGKNISPLPSPIEVFQIFISDSNLLIENGLITCLRSFLGLSLALIASLIIILTIGIFKKSEQLFYPAILFIKASPIIAFAPLIVETIGPESIFSKVVVSSMISFFPIVIGGIDGMENTPLSYSIMADSYGARGFKKFRHIYSGHAFYSLLTGLKTAAPLSVVGAMVGEYVIGSTNYGLGAIIMNQTSSFNYPLIMAAALTGTAIALLFFMLSYMFQRFVSNSFLHLNK